MLLDPVVADAYWRADRSIEPLMLTELDRPPRRDHPTLRRTINEGPAKRLRAHFALALARSPER